MSWKRMLTYISGSVNEDLLCRLEYLLEENRVLCESSTTLVAIARRVEFVRRSQTRNLTPRGHGVSLPVTANGGDVVGNPTGGQ